MYYSRPNQSVDYSIHLTVGKPQAKYSSSDEDYLSKYNQFKTHINTRGLVSIACFEESFLTGYGKDNTDQQKLLEMVLNLIFADNNISNCIYMTL